jgi:hypothetical protein
MIAVRQASRSVLLVCAIAGLATLGGCADKTPTGPSWKPPSISRDDNPPDEPCASGWIVVDGRWVCLGI